MKTSSCTLGCKLLDQIAEAFAATDYDHMCPGGSAAKLVRFSCRSGSAVVAKYQHPGGTPLDGHELDALKRKVAQIRLLHRRFPAFSPYCVSVLGEFECDGAYGFVMPYYDGPTLTERLLSGESDGLTDVSCLIDVMVDRGYARETYAASPEHFVETHVDRVRRRLDVVLGYLPPDLLRAEWLEVNGRRTRHAGPLLASLERRPQLMRDLRPSALAAPLHGDAVLTNFIWNVGALGHNEFTAIDPRGTLRAWDPVYDFSKILFSLSIHDLALTSGFFLRLVGGRESAEVEFRLRGESRIYQRCALGLFDTMQSLPSFARLPMSREAHWRKRTLFANAMHCLAFAACRAVDTRDDGSTLHGFSGTGHRPDVIGFYLAGVVLLGALLDADEAGDTLSIDRYLDLLPQSEAAPIVSARTRGNEAFSPTQRAAT